MSVNISSAVHPLAAAPDDIAALAKHWQDLCGARKYPSRGDMDPADLRPYLGFLSILKVEYNPIDFIHSLFGGRLVEYLQKDLTGKSVLELPSSALGKSIFKQLETTVETGAPLYFRTEVTYGNPSRKSGAAQFLLPLSDDGVTINRLLTYTRFDDAPPDFWCQIAA